MRGPAWHVALALLLGLTLITSFAFDARADEPAPLVSLVLHGGPVFTVNDRPCGAFNACPRWSPAFGADAFGRVVPSLGIGVGFVEQRLGSVIARPYGTTAYAQTHRARHYEVLARYFFGPGATLEPFVELGFGVATITATCTDGGDVPCGAGGAPTEDSVGAKSLRVGGGARFRLLSFLALDGALGTLNLVDGEGQYCTYETCESAPGTRIGIAAWFGLSVDLGRR